jgi:hypothetical protein
MLTEEHKSKHIGAVLTFVVSYHQDDDNYLFQLKHGFHTSSNSGVLVRQQTIPTERPPLVSEVSANFRG